MLQIFGITIIILINPISCDKFAFSLSRLSEEDSLRESLSECVLSACETYIDKGDTILYSIPITNPNQTSFVYLSHLIIPQLTTNWPIFIRNNLDNLIGKPRKPCNNYIIQIRTVDECRQHLQILSTDKFWNPHAKFLIISATVFTNPNDTANLLLQQLWDFRIINSVVFLVNPLNRTRFDVFTWYPFEPPNCGRHFSQAKCIDSCTFGDITDKTDWFEFVPKKFHNCEIVVRTIEAPPFIMNLTNNSYSTKNNYLINRGLELNLLDVIAERLDLKMFYIDSGADTEFGDVLANGTITGNLKYLEDSCDLAIGHYAKTFERSLKFDASNDYFQESLHWCVPHKRADNFDSLTKVITPCAWVVIIAAYLSISILTWLAVTNREARSYTNLAMCFLNSYSILLGIAVYKQPKSTRVRFIVGLLMLASFYLLSAYQTRVISVLSNKNYREQIDTFDDIKRNELKIYLPTDSRRYFASRKNPKRLNFILRNSRNCPDLESCYNQVAIKRDAAVCSPKSFYEYISNSYLDHNNEISIHCFKEAIVTYPINLLLRKGSPFFNRINRMIHRVLNSGLIMKWERDIILNRYQNVTVLGSDADYDTHQLDFFSLKPIFVILLIGHAVAVGVFLLEILYNRKYHMVIIRSVRRKILKWRK